MFEDQLGKIKDTIISRKYIFFPIGLILLAAIVWVYVINPVGPLEKAEINEIGIYSISSYTLWEIGFSQEDFSEVKSEIFSFDYSALLNGEAYDKMVNALRTTNSSYYLFGEPNQDDKVAIINIPISENEGFNLFISASIFREANGTFTGYKYVGDSKKWIGYRNTELGKVLTELRVKNLKL